MVVAKSLPNAPNKKAMNGVTLLFFEIEFFNCSKMVYCKIGLITRTNAGATPAKSACTPSSLMSDSRVLTVLGAFLTLPSALTACFLVVTLVLTTQIGFVNSTVADPASAPAIMLSRVVRFLLARPALMAAFSNAARVHSYQ